ncbi:MAG TPA: response regulator [Rhodopila sp.]
MTHPHILLVDDEHMVLDALESLLSDAGFTISRATTSDIALAIFKCHDIDLLITDIKMPGCLDGVALAGRMREKKPDLPVIFLSGSLDGLASSDRLTWPSAFLIKPIDITAAVDTIDRLISGRPARTGATGRRAASDGPMSDSPMSDSPMPARPPGTGGSCNNDEATIGCWDDNEAPVHSRARMSS